ncbi:MAG: VOC family protein [Gammaproteobacteria bacterium]|nr:VOC family protein [Gammaproteobacteria bacterium]
MARVLGIGGVFFKARDSKALADWYQRWLGMPVEPEWGGATLRPENMPAAGFTVWSPFSEDTRYFEPSDRPYMINLVVDNLDEALQQVAEGGAEVTPDIQQEAYGRFGWFIDPQGTKIELWEPAPVAAGSEPAGDNS